MRRLFRSAVVSLPILFSAFAPTASRAATLGFDTLSEEAPDVAWHNERGQTVELKSLRGTPVLMHFWATWCSSCRTELPELAKFAATLAPRGVHFLALAVEEEGVRPQATAFLRSLGLSDHILLTGKEGRDLKPYLTWGLPVTYLVSASGQVVARALGPRPWAENPEAAAGVLKLLGAAKLSDSPAPVAKASGSSPVPAP